MKIVTVVAGIIVSFGLISTAVADDYLDAMRVLDAGDSVGAIAYLKPCSERGETRCEVALASFYQRGEGTRINIEKALVLYERAARKGDIIAQLNLAEIYEKGSNGQTNFQRAYLWYSLAADQGREGAIKKAKALASELSAVDLKSMKARKQLIQENL